MRVYVTKYALTAGIEVKDVKYLVSDRDANRAAERKHVYSNNPMVLQEFVMGKDAFLTYPEAVKAAREMRNKKEQSLRRQLAEVSDLIFPTKDPFGLE